MKRKLGEMDEMIKDVVGAIDEDTLFVVSTAVFMPYCPELPIFSTTRIPHYFSATATAALTFV